MYTFLPEVRLHIQPLYQQLSRLSARLDYNWEAIEISERAERNNLALLPVAGAKQH